LLYVYKEKCAYIRRKISILLTAAAAAKLLQSCPTLCDPIDGSPPGSLIPGILQARVLRGGAIGLYLWRKNTEKLRQKIPPYWLQSHNSVYKVFK